MSKVLSLILLFFSIFLIVITTIVVRKGKMPIKYSLVWYFSAFILLFIAVLPNLFWEMTSLVGFETPSNFILAMIITLLLFITMTLTIIVSGQKATITLLVQEVSMLKSRGENNHNV